MNKATTKTADAADVTDVKTPAAKPPVAKPRATFAAAAFGNLRAAAGEGQGEPLRILLADIDEDPDQPRTVFDELELQSMAETIKAHGVVQPIVVRPPVNGRYMLAFGARRLRASRLAGVSNIPAFVRSKDTGTFAAQVIENQHRANLANSDLAAAIARLAEEGSSNKDIAAVCSLKDYQVAAFRQVGNFPPELARRIDSSDIRALYDLYRQWTKTPAEVIAGLPNDETVITVTEARRIIGGITGKPTGSIVLDRVTAPPAVSRQEPPSAAPAAPLAPAPEDRGEERAPAPVAQAPALDPDAPATGPKGSEAPARPRPVPAPTPARQANGAPVFIVAMGDGQPGRLVVDQRAEREGSALVAYETGLEEVDAADLRIVRIE